MKRYIVLLAFVSLSATLWAQGHYDKEAAKRVVLQKDSLEGDSLYFAILPDITVLPKFRSRYAPLTAAEKETYWRRIRDVKKVLPYAKMLAQTLIETYEYMETLPNDRARSRHLNRLEKDLMQEYKPIMKQLTLRQGELLMKLVHRQTNTSSYNLIKAFYGGFKAGWYNLFASFFGGDLKVTYDPRYNADDAFTERVVYLCEHNLL